jgi:hypothetical protein
MAEKSKTEMDQEVLTGLRGLPPLKDLHIRSGNPQKLNDLVRVNATKAGVIILLQPEKENEMGAAEVRKAAVMMGLTALEPGEAELSGVRYTRQRS